MANPIVTPAPRNSESNEVSLRAEELSFQWSDTGPISEGDAQYRKKQAEVRQAEVQEAEGETIRSKRMRFEIGPGGGIVVLAGLLGLSAAVFLLGMISERKIAQSEQGQSQLASVYPMPVSAPPDSPQQAAAPVEPRIAAGTLKPPPQTEIVSENIPPAPPPKPSQDYKAPSHSALASVPPAHRSDS